MLAVVILQARFAPLERTDLRGREEAQVALMAHVALMAQERLERRPSASRHSLSVRKDRARPRYAPTDLGSV